MSRTIRGKNGQFAGSIGSGKLNVPSANPLADLPGVAPAASPSEATFTALLQTYATREDFEENGIPMQAYLDEIDPVDGSVKRARVVSVRRGLVVIKQDLPEESLVPVYKAHHVRSEDGVWLFQANASLPSFDEARQWAIDRLAAS